MESLASILLRVAAALLGLPCVAVLVLWLVARLKAPPPSPGSVVAGVDHPDAVLWTLEGLQRAIGAAGRGLDGLSRIAMSGAAALALCGLVLSVGLWFTGRGLASNAPWARVVALGFVALVGLTAALITIVTRR
ncbi:MAG: hypothetical protein R3F49_23890 [Planctomycetota bacterium]